MGQEQSRPEADKQDSSVDPLPPSPYNKPVHYDLKEADTSSLRRAREGPPPEPILEYGGLKKQESFNR